MSNYPSWPEHRLHHLHQAATPCSKQPLLVCQESRRNRIEQTHLPLFSGCIDSMMDLRRIGGCVPLFFLAIAFDVVGFIILFVGIFANLRIEGRFYGDFLIYSGSILLFISLAWWVMWYVGNIQVSEDSFGTSLLEKKQSFVQLARKLSERLSKKCKPEDTITKYAEKNKVNAGTPSSAHVASRITWGKSFAYQNGDYDSSLDSFSMEKGKKTPDVPNVDVQAVARGNVERLF